MFYYLQTPSQLLLRSNAVDLEVCRIEEIQVSPDDGEVGYEYGIYMRIDNINDGCPDI